MKDFFWNLDFDFSHVECVFFLMLKIEMSTVFVKGKVPGWFGTVRDFEKEVAVDAKELKVSDFA